MNIVMKNSIRYCGSSTIAAIMGVGISAFKKQDVCIVTNDIRPYTYLFKLKLNNDILLNDQTKELAIMKASSLDDKLKCYCHNVDNHLFILEIENPDIVLGMTKNMYYSDSIFIYDIKGFKPDTKTIKYYIQCFTNDNIVKLELLDYMASISNTVESRRTIFVCNKFDYGIDNQKKIAKELNLKITDIIYFKRALLMKQLLNKGRFSTFVIKALNNEPMFEIYSRQIKELIDLGG